MNHQTDQYAEPPAEVLDAMHRTLTMKVTAVATILDVLGEVDEFLNRDASPAVRAELDACCAARGANTEALLDSIGFMVLSLRWAVDAADPSRDDPATMHCPVCAARFTPTGRQRYCSTACRKTAFRRRHANPATTLVVPAARPRRQVTVYECPSCGQRLLGEQRCGDCATFARRVGIGGSCPDCAAPVAVDDLLDGDTTITAAPARTHKETP